MAYTIKNRSRLSLSVVAVPLLIALNAGLARADIETYEAVLSGDQEVPAVATAASGSMTLVVDTDLLEATWSLEFADLSAAQTGAHIHAAPVGANGGVVLALPLGSPVNGAWTLSAAQYAALSASGYYVNVHTSMFAGGEIRGQLIRSSTVADEEVALDAVKALYR